MLFAHRAATQSTVQSVINLNVQYLLFARTIRVFIKSNTTPTPNPSKPVSFLPGPVTAGGNGRLELQNASWRPSVSDPPLSQNWQEFQEKQDSNIPKVIK